MNAGPPTRPPAFMRRNLAARADDEALVALACDENMWVRREAARNPATPDWVLDLLVRAGADPDLRGRREPDPAMRPEDLRQLVECGPWAHLLVAAHPNTESDVLDLLAEQSNPRLRSAVAVHPHASASSLAHLCADADPEIRGLAVAHHRRPETTYQLLRSAGSNATMSGLEPRATERLAPRQFGELAALGPWGRFLVGRQPRCPVHLLDEVAADPDWEIQSALLDNPATPDALIERVVESPPPYDDLRNLADRDASPSELTELASHAQTAVRLAVVRHPNTPPDMLAALATDRSASVRRSASMHPHLDPLEHESLVRAGSSTDLTKLAEPDPTLDRAVLDRLALGGHWARQLAVRHTATSPATLARLLCDGDGKLREWAAAHPATPKDVIDDIRRVGGAVDFQGVAEGEPDVPVEVLRRVAGLGPWGAWVVSWHPKAPADLERRSAPD